MSPKCSYALSPGSTQFASMCRIQLYENTLAQRRTGEEQSRQLANINLREISLVAFCEAPVSMLSNVLALMVQSPVQRTMTMSEAC